MIKFRIAGSKFLLGLQLSLTSIKVEPRNLKNTIADAISDILPPNLIPPGFGDNVIRKLEALGKEESATPYMALLAAFKLLLARMTGQGDGEAATPASQRQQPSMQNRPAAAAPQPRQEADQDQERIEIPAFLRRQAN